MKSIKEKAEENCIKYGNLGNIAYQEFVAGANYVLDAIIDVINQPMNDYMVLEELKEMILQPKK